MSFFIAKKKDRFQSLLYLKGIRSRPCCGCRRHGIFSASTASHMISVKRAAGSDALALPACMPKHHVASTRTSRRLLENEGIIIEDEIRKCWMDFAFDHNLVANVNLFLREFSEAQVLFEELLIANNLGKRAK